MEENNVNLSFEEKKEPVAEPVAETATAEVQPEKTKKEDALKKLLKNPVALVAGALVVLVLLVSLLASLLSSPDFYVAESELSVVQLSEDEYMVIFDSKNQVKLTDVEFRASSPYQDAVLYVDDEGALYYLEAGDKEGMKVAENVTDAMFSSDGKRFIYTVNQTEKDENGEEVSSEKFDVYVVKSGKKEGQLIASDATQLVPSPDFETFFYFCDEEGFLYDGKSEKVSVHKDYRIIGISNDAKYVYSLKSEYIEAEDYTNRTLYVQKGFDGDRVKLSEKIEGLYVFNYDGSEIYYEVEGAAYLSVKGEKSEKVMNQSTENFLTVPGILSSSYAIRSLPVKTFVGRQIVGGNDGLYTIGKDSAQTVKIASGIGRALLSEDGESVLYYKDGDLYRIHDLYSEGEAEKIEMDLDISSWKATHDLKKIYILTEDGDLYYVKGNSAPKKVEGGSDITRFALSDNGKYCFAEKDGEWYYSSNGGKLKKVAGIDGEADIEINKNFILLKTEEAVYISNGGTKFEKIGEFDFPEENTTEE